MVFSNRFKSVVTKVVKFLFITYISKFYRNRWGIDITNSFYLLKKHELLLILLQQYSAKQNKLNKRNKQGYALAKYVISYSLTNPLWVECHRQKTPLLGVDTVYGRQLPTTMCTYMSVFSNGSFLHTESLTMIDCSLRAEALIGRLVFTSNIYSILVSITNRKKMSLPSGNLSSTSYQSM